jgi:hypothetical protein
MALIIVLSVMSGFEADLQKKILGTNSHGVVMKYTPEMPEYAEVVEKIHQVRGITGATPFILNEVMVSSEGNISGSMIKGIDPNTVGSVTDLPSSLGCTPGKPCQPMEALDDPTKIRVRRLEPLPADAGVRLTLEDDAVSRACFPFAFRLELELRTEPGALAIEARILHKVGAGGEEVSPPLPFSLGLHPYLAVEDPARVRLEGLPPTCLDQAAMAAANTAERLEHLGEGVDLLAEATACVRLVDPLAGRAVTLDTRSPMDRVVVWTDPPRPMVCLEPWTARRGELGLALAAGEQLELNCRYTLVPG